MKILLATLFVFAFSTFGFGQQFQIGTTILLTVNQTGDSVDVNPGNGECLDANGQCTLRAAVQEANAHPGSEVINFTLPLPSVIDLTLGELPIRGMISIVGPGARNLTVERSHNANTPNFRIFNLFMRGLTFIEIRDLQIKNGNAGNGLSGGGINIGTGVTANLTGTAISENTAGAGGGGIANAGNLNLTRSLINANTSGGAGGGILNIDSASSANVTDSTLTNNSAVSGGGVENNGTLQLANDTISQNSASSSASSIASNSGGNVYAVNSIIGNDISSTVSSLSGAFISLGYNIVTKNSGSTGFTDGVNNDQVSDNNQINPLLGDLTNNGGQTDTKALSADSPAINLGSNCVYTFSCGFPNESQLPRLNSDQRSGYNRYQQGKTDIGAFEFGSSNSTIFANISLFSGLRGTHSYNSLVILTNARTGAKRYTVINPFGAYRFYDLSGGEVYILETRGKRIGTSGAGIIPLDDLPMGINLNKTQPVEVTINPDNIVVKN